MGVQCRCETLLRYFTFGIALNKVVVSIAVDWGLPSAAVDSQNVSAPSL